MVFDLDAMSALSGEKIPIEALRKGAALLPEPVFVVLDGAKFDDLPGRMAAAKLFANSLFRGWPEAILKRPDHG